MAFSERAGPGRPRKRFGQHFLNDQTVIVRIVEALHSRPGEILCEIGPGRGALSDRLAALDNELHLVEIDRDLVPLLQKRYAAQSNIHIHEQDSLTLALENLHAARRVVMVLSLIHI